MTLHLDTSYLMKNTVTIGLTLAIRAYGVDVDTEVSYLFAVHIIPKVHTSGQARDSRELRTDVPSHVISLCDGRTIGTAEDVIT